MSNLLESLESIGFSRNESKVYLNLAKNGSSKAGQIAKSSLLDRSSVYNALQSLLNKGLVSYVTIGKIRWFQCSDPKNIIINLKDKINSAKDFVHEIDKIRSEIKTKDNVRLFKGEKGVKTVFENILRTADENLIFGSEGHFSNKMPAFAKRFNSLMENRGINVRSIIRTNRKKPSGSTKVRTIPSKTKSSVVTNIYGDRIAIIIWSEVPEAILIKNESAAKAWRDYFNFMWKHADR